MNNVANNNFNCNPVVHNEHSEETAKAIAEAVSNLARVLENISKGFESPTVGTFMRFES